MSGAGAAMRVKIQVRLDNGFVFRFACLMASNPAGESTSPRPELLAVSFAFPPLALPRSIQVARLLKHLHASTVLVCAPEEKDIRQDHTIEPDAEGHLRACLRVPFALRGWRRQVTRVAHRLDLPVWNKAPDQYVAWKPDVLAAIAAFAREENYAPDALVSFGYPMSDHLIGLELKRLYRVPWLAHFSDPWVGNAYSNNGRDRWSRARNVALERKVMAAADRVIFTSQETVEMVLEKYPASWRAKARVLPQCFDSASYPARPASESDIVIRHTGWFYGPRTPAPLVKAIHKLLTENPDALRGVRFELIGDVAPETIANIGLESLPAGMVVIIPPVNYQDSLALIAAADGLAVIDAPAEKSVFLPSKLIDYIGAGRPILGLTPTGAAAGLITELGGPVADPSDLQAMTRALESFLAHLRRLRAAQSREPWGKPVVRQRYAAPFVAQSFADTLRELLV